MKYTILLLISFAVFGFTSCSSQGGEKTIAKDGVNEQQVIANAQVTLAVDGMTCAAGCAKAIEKTLNKKSSIASATVDFENKKCVIDYNSDLISEEEIMASFSEIGKGDYSATKIKNTDS